MLSSHQRAGVGSGVGPKSGRVSALSELHSPYLIPILLVFSALSFFGFLNLSRSGYGTDFFWGQVRNFVPALFVMVLCGWVIPLRFFNSYAYWLFGAIGALLLVVLFTGHVAGGSQRWVNLGFMKFQPSEFAKLTCANLVARYFFTSRLQTAYRLRDLWPLLAMIGFVFALVFEQPDLGTAGLCLLVVTIQLCFIRIDKRSLAIVGATALTIGVIGWNFLHDYQRLRVVNLFNPDYDPHGSGYNSLQSLVAIGSGSMWGKGFMKGTQTQLQFLPARHTDFAFAVFAEEHGFFWSAAVFLLFGALIYLALTIARHSKETYSAMLAVGVAAILFIGFLINVAMVLGMFPVVGVPLPMFSCGGSSLLTVCSCVGLLISVDRQNMRRAGGFV